MDHTSNPRHQEKRDWIRKIVDNCVELTEINLSHSWLLSLDSINYLVSNITKKLQKISFNKYSPDRYCSQNEHAVIKDDQVEVLVKRCNKLTTLDLSLPILDNRQSITNRSLTSIIQNLKNTLEALNLTHTGVRFFKLLELMSMPKLKVLSCHNCTLTTEEENSLRKHLPNVNVNALPIYMFHDYTKIAIPHIWSWKHYNIWEVFKSRESGFQQWAFLDKYDPKSTA